MGFVLSAIGSAVGLGNLWRFPYVVGSHGMGSFILAYLISLILIGIPTLLLEYYVGARRGKGPIKSWKEMYPHKWYFSLIPLVFLFIIISYYVVITGWTLLFTVQGNTLTFSHINESYLSVLGMATTLGIAYIILRQGVRNGVEKLNKILVPLLFVLIIGLLAYGLYSFGTDGIGALFSINPEKLMDVDLWIFTLSQAFFSLGVGWLVLYTYASYSRNSDLSSLIRSSLITAVADTSVALLSAAFIFTVAYGMDINVGQGPTFMFDTIGTLFADELSLPLLSSILYFTLFIAAITSVVSVLEVLVSSFSSLSDLNRNLSLGVITLTVGLMAMLSALSYSELDLRFGSERVLDVLDGDLIGRFSIIPVSVVVFMLAWSQDSESLSTHLRIYLRYVVPVVFLLLMIGSFI